MEIWKVEEVHLERETLDRKLETHTVACEAVEFTPTSSPSEGMKEGGSLNVQCEQAPGTLPWPPTRIRFKAARYVEERLFEVGGYRIEASHIIFLLTSPATHVDTNASDGHIGSYHSSDART